MSPNTMKFSITNLFFLIVLILLTPCLVLAAADVSIQTTYPNVSKQINAQQAQVMSESGATQIALNSPQESSLDANAVSASSGPILLVPLVLAILALVAVSRRKEDDQ
jgi:P pilus assembly chaperone PapD